MSMKYLGESFDIHCGAVDLIFPHHENEIAQSEAASGQAFVKYWVHGEHLIVDGEKMAKSKGNFYTLQDLIRRGIDPRQVRYTLQSVPYKRQLNFTFDALRQAESALKRLQDFRLGLITARRDSGSKARLQELNAAVLHSFERAMDDDLNTAQALAAIFDWVREVNTVLSEGAILEEDRSAALRVIDRINEVLVLWRPYEDGLDQKIKQLIEERNQARMARNYPLSDKIRDQILEMGYIIEDTKDGVRWKKR